jgi:hypothetical protein
MHDLSPDEALRIIANATASLAATDLILAENLAALRQTHRLAVWLQACTIVLLGVSIVGMGWVLWYSSTQHAQIAEILRLMSK